MWHAATLGAGAHFDSEIKLPESESEKRLRTLVDILRRLGFSPSTIAANAYLTLIL